MQELIHKSTALTERFVEKFFQMEYWLPTYNLDKIRDAILNTCHDFLLEDDYNDLENYLKINDRQSFGKSRHPLKNGVDNLRIAIRWMHSFKISYSRLKGNVLATDLADIELLKLIAPAFFDSLRSNWLSFVDETNNGLKLWGRDEVDTGTHNDDWIRNLFSKEKHNIFNMDNFVTMPMDLQVHVKDILSRLLPDYGGGKDKSFSNRNYTDRYFFNSLQDDEIEEAEFNQIMSNDLEGIRNILKTPVFSNKFKWFSILINRYVPKNLSDLLKYIRIIFYAGSLSSEFQINPFDFVYKLKPYKDECKIIGTEFTRAINTNRASMFTLKFFIFLKHGVPEKMYKPYICDLTPQIVAFEMLKYAVQDKKGFSEITEYFWESGENTNNGGKEVYIPNSDAVGVYRLYWEERFQSLFPKLIYRQMPPDEDNTYVAAKLVTILWPDKEEFFKLFTNMEKDNAAVEAESFFRKALSNDYLIAQFKFKHLKIKSNE